MPIEDQVRTVVSAGEDCLVCEKKIKAATVAVEVSFRINLLITSKDVTYQMHLQCGQQLHDLLGRRLAEGRREDR